MPGENNDGCVHACLPHSSHAIWIDVDLGEPSDVKFHKTKPCDEVPSTDPVSALDAGRAGDLSDRIRLVYDAPAGERHGDRFVFLPEPQAIRRSRMAVGACSSRASLAIQEDSAFDASGSRALGENSLPHGSQVADRFDASRTDTRIFAFKQLLAKRWCPILHHCASSGAAP